MSEAIKVQHDGRFASIVIARESRRNSLDNPALEQFLEALRRLRPLRLSALVIAGEGTKAFSAGSDLKALAQYNEAEVEYHTSLIQECATAIDDFPCATIAAIEGFCLGGGLEIALACDYRIASRASQFGFPEIEHGVLPTGGGTIRAPRAVGLMRAREMLIFGKRLSADQALIWGLISEVAEPGSVFEAACKMGREYAQRTDPILISLAKRLIVAGYEGSTKSSQAMALIADMALSQTSTFRDGVTGFGSSSTKASAE